MRICKYRACFNLFKERKNKIYCSRYCCIKDRVIKLRINNKLRAVKYKGGKCVFCGYDRSLRALEFHHVNPKLKDHEFDFCHTLNWETIKKELDKCILLCSNCHAEEEERISLEKIKEQEKEKLLLM